MLNIINKVKSILKGCGIFMEKEKKNEWELNYDDELEEDKQNINQGISTMNNQEGDYLIIYGKYNYGSRIKNYGLFAISLDIEKKKLIATELVVGNRDEILNLYTKFENGLFIEGLEEIHEKNYKDYDMKLNFKNNITSSQIFEVLNRKGQEIKIFFKEKLENILQEQIELQSNNEKITLEELEATYPELISSEEVVDDSSQDDIKIGAEEDDEEEVKKEGKINIDIKLNCLPIISPVTGRKITQLKEGDKLAVKVNDNRNVAQELINQLQNEDGIAIGIIEEVDFNQDSERYNILVKFKSNIYGALVVEPELKLEAPEVKERRAEEKEDSIEVDQQLLLLFGSIGLLILLLVIIIILYL